MIKILVVEDDAGLNMTVCAFLRKNGYEVTGCMHANDAYNAMYNNLFDLIISDVMMPQIDGFEFAETVRKINQTIPIIFMTARDDFTSKQKGFAAGIDDYLVKPVDLDELLLRISAILRRAKMQQFEHSLALPFFGIGMKNDLFQSCGQCCFPNLLAH